MKKIFALLFFLIATNIYSYAQTQFSVMLHEQATQYNEKEIIALEDGGYVTKELIYDPIVNNGWSMYHVVLTKLLDDAEERRRMSRVHNPYGDGQASRRIADAIAGFRRANGVAQPESPKGVR